MSVVEVKLFFFLHALQGSTSTYSPAWAVVLGLSTPVVGQRCNYGFRSLPLSVLLAFARETKAIAASKTAASRLDRLHTVCDASSRSATAREGTSAGNTRAFSRECAATPPRVLRWKPFSLLQSLSTYFSTEVATWNEELQEC